MNGYKNQNTAKEGEGATAYSYIEECPVVFLPITYPGISIARSGGLCRGIGKGLFKERGPGAMCVVRNGDSSIDRNYLRSACRNKLLPTVQKTRVGFRVVLSR